MLASVEGEVLLLRTDDGHVVSAWIAETYVGGGEALDRAAEAISHLAVDGAIQDGTRVCITIAAEPERET
jgi:hypothetical protein